MKTYEESATSNHSDTEITLGTRSILGIFFGLVLICGVFFGLGYSLGRGNPGKPASSAQTALPSPETTQPPAVKTVVEQSAPAIASSPGNGTYVADPGAPTHKAAETTAPAKPPAASAMPPAPAASTTGSITSTDQAQAKALSNTPSPAKATPAVYPVQASATPAATIMVQIAAVSHQQDADVLVSALKKLGYSASVRSETADNLLHVQIGPFATRDEAMAMRAKLLNDGYNAILK